LLATTGCYSFTTLGRARTIGKGHIQAFAAPEAMIVPGGGSVMVRPIGEIGARYGITDRLDAEARVTTFGFSGAAHVQLRRGGLYGIDLMLAPGFAFTSPDKLTFEVPFVFGLNLPKDNQIVVAPRAAYQIRFANGFGRPINFLFAGLSVGFAWRLSKAFTLLPEFAFLKQTYSEPGFESSVAGTVGIQGALGILVDF
jgi:hypothetical protein